MENNIKVIGIVGIILIIVASVVFFGKGTVYTIVGTLEFSYSFSPDSRKALFIGSNYFLPSTLQFNCENQYDRNAWIHRTPKECWSTDIIWNDDGNIQHFTMIPGETIQLNDYFEVTFNPEGHTNYDSLTNGHDLRHWNNKFTFKIINKDFLSAKAVDDDYEILLNSDKKMKIEITNKLAPNMRGGMWTKTTNLMLFREKMSNSYFYLQKGTKIYEKVPAPTDFLGDLEVEWNPFVIINNNIQDIKLMDNTQSYIEYRVVRVLSGITCDMMNEVCCEDGVLRRECDRVRLGLSYGVDCSGDMNDEIGDYPDDEVVEGEWKSINNYWWIMGIIIIMIVLGLIIWQIRKR